MHCGARHPCESTVTGALYAIYTSKSTESAELPKEDIRKRDQSMISDYQKSLYDTLGMNEGAAAPSYEIRSSDMCAARSGCKPLPISFSGRTRSVQENDV